MTPTYALKTVAGGRRSPIALSVLLAFAVCTALAADKSAHENRTELRIKDLHTKLKITPTQESQWSAVAAAMRENAKVMDSLTKERVKHAKDMSAVDDLSSYAKIADANADGIHKLGPLFTALYTSMPDPQQKEIDTLFRRGVHDQNGLPKPK